MGPFTSALLRGPPLLLSAHRELARILFFHAANLRDCKDDEDQRPMLVMWLEKSENAGNIVVPIFSGAWIRSAELWVMSPITLATAPLRC